MFNTAAASSMGASHVRTNSSGYRINITQVNGVNYTYPPKVPPLVINTVNFYVNGTLTKDGKPVTVDRNMYLYHGEVVSNVPNPTLWMVPIMPDGSFTDWFQFSSSGQFSSLGRHDLIYTYFWGNGSSDFCQSDVISIYVVQQK